MLVLLMKNRKLCIKKNILPKGHSFSKNSPNNDKEECYTIHLLGYIVGALSVNWKNSHFVSKAVPYY